MAVEDQIQAFIDYLHNVKHTSENTELSYHRDLNKVKAYLEEQGITDIKNLQKETVSLNKPPLKYQFQLRSLPTF